MRLTFDASAPKFAAEFINKAGLNEKGKAQWDFTLNVQRRIKKYIPQQSGVLSEAWVSSADTLEFPEPYAAYQYFGKVMVNAKTGKGPGFIPGVGYRYKKGTVLKPTERNLDQSKGKAPKGGPFWDRRLIAEEGEAIMQDVVNGIRGRTGID